MIGTAITGLFSWLLELPWPWLILIFFAATAFILASIYYGLRVYEWWQSKKRPLEIIFEPVPFGQNTPPYGELRLLKLSDVDDRIRERVELEKEYGIQPGGLADGLCSFMLYRVGIHNKTAKTIKNVRLELTAIKDMKNAFLPTILRLRHSPNESVDLSGGEREFFDVVATPVLDESQWKSSPRPSIAELIIIYANPSFPNRVPPRTYNFHLTARGNDVNSDSLWFRLEMNKSGSFDFTKSEES